MKQIYYRCFVKTVMSHNNEGRGEDPGFWPEVIYHTRDKSSFTAAQIAVQTNYFTPGKTGSQFPAQIRCLTRTPSDILHLFPIINYDSQTCQSGGFSENYRFRFASLIFSYIL